MAEKKDQSQKQKSERISEGSCMSWEMLGQMMAAGNKEKNHYTALVNSANEMMLVFKAYKEAGFSDEQAFKVVLTILATAIGGKK